VGAWMALVYDGQGDGDGPGVLPGEESLGARPGHPGVDGKSAEGGGCGLRHGDRKIRVFLQQPLWFCGTSWRCGGTWVRSMDLAAL